MDSQSSDASIHGRDEFSAILNSAIHGDSHSRSALFEQIQPKLELYLSQQSGLSLRRKIQIEDMCQDVFLRALKVLTTLPEEATQQDFLNLVLKNAHWTVLDAVKKNERFKGESNIPGGIVSVPLDPDAHGGEALIIEREESEWLHGLIDRLEENYSSVLWLKLDGLETAEVSERLGISQELVRKRYQRAIDKLKQFTDR
ncbi:MAG: RNA polymerase sigma factor [Planctomycetota bacterium]